MRSTVTAPAKHEGLASMLEAGAVGTAFLLPLVFWPASESPFSTAKLWLLAAWVSVGLTVAVSGRLYRTRPFPKRAALALTIWIFALSLSAALGAEVSLRALFEALLPCGSFLLLLWIAPKPQKIVQALVVSGTLVAVVAILQYLHLDPFRLFGMAGSIPGGSRIQVFSTLGNPNFVASFLACVLPLTLTAAVSVGLAGRGGAILSTAAALIQAGAIVATGSRAPIPAFLAAGAWLLYRRSRNRMRFLGVGLSIVALLLLFSPARPLGKTIAGRFYIWRVVAKHVPEIPLTGYGPGAFALRFADWETAWLRLSPENAGNVFVGLQDHAHNDYLEILVDHGIVGLTAFLLMLFLLTPAFRKSDRSGGRFEDGLTAAVIVLLTVALVDFPLHRPADLYLLWTLFALIEILRETGGCKPPEHTVDLLRNQAFERKST